jgi:DNA-binding beta-propeller fold protein YncE
MRFTKRAVTVIAVTIAALAPLAVTTTASASLALSTAQSGTAAISVTATIPVGASPVGVAVDPATNTIYVVNKVFDGTESAAGRAPW